MSDPNRPDAICQDASSHGASMRHVYELCGIIRLIAEERDRYQREAQEARGRAMKASEATTILYGQRDDAVSSANRERERANEWLSLLHDLRNVAHRGLSGDATSADIEHVIACVDATLVRS